MIALLVIGDEILSSQVRDENLSFMIEAFSTAGYDIGEARVIRDDVEQIAAAFRELAAQYDIVISAGGVGPTHDDITLKSAAQAFNEQLELNQDMVRFLTGQHTYEVTEPIRRMASMPAGTTVLGADDVHWPIVKYENCYILPGLPVALRSKVDRILKMLPVQQPVWVARIYLTVDESAFADQLAAFQEEQSDIAIGSYPVVGMSEYRAYITIKSRDPERVHWALSELVSELGQREWVSYTEGPVKSGELPGRAASEPNRRESHGGS
jgi:molybdenum cofactor synthesis domain-containing protein